jgi:hypothetical protein
MVRAATSLKSRNWNSKRKGSKGIIVMISIVIGLLLTLMFLLLFNVNVSSDNALSTPNVEKFLHASSALTLENEQRFTSTIKDCKRVAKCKQHLPNEEHPNLQRVAFISTGKGPPEKLYEIFKQAILIYYGNDQQMMDKEIELVNTQHVPPYGYGKSHGWTKIIRIMHSPLLIETIESLQSSDETLSLEDIVHSPSLIISQGMRQVIRFHCRISHVAAHTFMYNLDLSSDQFRNQVSKAIAYVTAEPGHHPKGSDFRHIDRMENVDAYLDKTLSAPLSNTAMQLNNIVSDKELKQLEQVLTDELDSTDNLSKWPCKSLWDLDGLEKDGSDIVSKNAKRLSPDCNAPYTSCFVKRDLCEMKGDALCG